MSGRSGDFVSTDNTAFQGIGFTVAPTVSSNAVFTNIEAHSRPLSVTALPNHQEYLHYPFVHTDITAVALSQSWWSKVRLGPPPVFLTYVYFFFMGPLDADHVDGWLSNPIDVGYDNDLGWFMSTPGGNHLFTVPDDQWLQWSVAFDASHTFTLTITDAQGETYLDHSADLSAFGEFAFHTWVVTARSYFQNWVDDFELDAEIPVSSTSLTAPATAIDLFR